VTKEEFCLLQFVLCIRSCRGLDMDEGHRDLSEEANRRRVANDGARTATLTQAVQIIGAILLPLDLYQL